MKIGTAHSLISAALKVGLGNAGTNSRALNNAIAQFRRTLCGELYTEVEQSVLATTVAALPSADLPAYVAITEEMTSEGHKALQRVLDKGVS
jgi:hypothetical protein